MKILYIKKKNMYVFVTILIIVILVLIMYSIYLNKAKNTFKRDIFYAGNTNEKIIAFTCNVDWGNEYIPQMLEIFENEEIKITFFITGRWADDNKDLLKEIYSHGHEIGNHGYYHKEYGKLSYEINKNEIEKCDESINNILGIKCKYFAPPSGSYNDNTIRAARDLNYDIIMWSIDTIDWREDSTSEKIISRVLTKANNSGIVLMHPTENTVRALPVIIKSLKEEGYTIGRVSDIIKKASNGSIEN